MRLWSLHPRMLDKRGLVALWREALLAQAVLAGKTKGYKHHPQLIRFKEHDNPMAAIGSYLSAVADEADDRGYNFNRALILNHQPAKHIPLPTGQVAYEWGRLIHKVEQRSPGDLCRLKTPTTHPLFVLFFGPVAAWEKNT